MLIKDNKHTTKVLKCLINKGKNGKGTSIFGSFAGFGEGTLNKAIKERLKNAKG